MKKRHHHYQNWKSWYTLSRVELHIYRRGDDDENSKLCSFSPPSSFVFLIKTKPASIEIVQQIEVFFLSSSIIIIVFVVVAFVVVGKLWKTHALDNRRKNWLVEISILIISISIHMARHLFHPIWKLFNWATNVFSLHYRRSSCRSRPEV